MLDVKDLHVTFVARGQKFHVVRGIHFSLFEGEALGIVGESGCGKSSAVKALLKLLPLYTSQVSGEVWYKKENLFSYAETQMRQIRGKEIAMIFQDPLASLNPTLKVGSQIIEGYCNHFLQASKKEGKKVALELLNQVGIYHAEEVLQAYPHTLSGGMCQRVMIALALACRPKILLADEPTTALDLTLQAQILNLLKKVQEQTKMSLVLITHDMNIVARFCDRVLVMYAGKIVEWGSVHEVFYHPQHPYTKQLLQAIPHRNQNKENPLHVIEGHPPSLTLPLRYCSFCSRCPDAMMICATEAPPLFPVTETHACACFKNSPHKIRVF